ncbi:glycosyltransferase family 2 protein [Paenibacillus sp. GCM10023248]|uniref:glycosyltransferase family 2 protein n=1 Tax=Bacillales TaxID=1385 RepID=UPI002379715C|nr:MULTISPECIES: glycosyltransferase family 2 protein [Bacillales]MDD9269950.1 glycosyltransferase family 2 protein [Paenibacillus sp. MAHUQ-63]MDR6883170.1 GT2 family glycosyltransferase [Bacillus sp. 3255]
MRRIRRIRRRFFKTRRAKRSKSYNQLYRIGYNLGYDNAHGYGYQNGWEAGIASYSQPFKGTSIIIVTTNDQRVHLQNCIDSIYAYTPEPFEIIVIDNASTDDTADYLKSLRGKIRYRVFKSNLGFAGGTNQGLRLARGETLLFLNNDTIVTKDWLKNMLICLHSSEKIGLVGPVTNYISGEQLIETQYTSTEEMHHFARKFNVSDPGKWVQTGRLTGFCVLMRREFFDRLSYLDEGFEIGNCEDDDFGFRARMMGHELIVAKDTFIHHVGSVSIKALGELFEKVYSKNLDFFSRKWGDSHSLLHEVQQKLAGGIASMNDFYPSHTIVRGVLPQLYWIENGTRYPIEGELSLLASRISQVDLRSWPIGSPVSSQDVEAKLAYLAQGVQADGALPEGLLVRNADSTVFQVKGNKLCRIINDWALSFWHLKERHQVTINGQFLVRYAQGLPIIAPASIVANNV